MREREATAAARPAEEDVGATAPMTPLARAEASIRAPASAEPSEGSPPSPAPATDAEPAPLSSAAPSTAAGATTRLLELVRADETHAWHQRLVRALSVGLAGWLCFLIPDAALVFLIGAAPPLPYLSARALPALGLGVVLFVLERSTAPRAWVLRGVEVVSFTLGTASVAVLAALHDEGITSFNVPGAVLVILAYGVTLGRGWRAALLPVACMTLAVPAVLGLATLLSPRIAAQWGDLHAALTFGSHYAVVLSGAALTLIGGELVSGLRQKVAEAHSIGRYRLRKRIAAGGMGEVWAAYHAGLGRDVAVKIIRAAAATEADVLRFEREVRATAELTHPNIVRVFDYGVTEDGVWYYAMELLEEEDLQRVVKREGPLAPRRALRLITQAAQALGEAHGRGIVHRDVKPANLLLQRAGSGGEYVKLIDFGIAHRADAVALTHTGMVVGTPGYIAPELLFGQPADARADVYALGAVLYFMLAGRMPFSGEDARALVLAHVHADVPSLAGRAKEPVPAALEAIVQRCLEKRPEDRYADADELARALLACQV